MNRVVLFLGPSLPKAIAEEILPEALILGPAAQGDIDFAARELGADLIGFCDGVHRQQLSVFHKEVLGALQLGSRVLGAASMGALRAVECEPWGSEPLGEVASWYASRKIDGDDEVCLAHGDESMGYRHFSVPLVNLRATLISVGLSENHQQDIIEAAREIFYADRTWSRIFDAAEIRGELRANITACEIDIKYADALHLCHHLANPGPKPVPTRQARNAFDGYGWVFQANDSKVMHNGKVMRRHEIAGSNPRIFNLAGQRKLALEFCRMVGIPVPSPNDEDRLGKEQDALSQGLTWLSSSRATFGNVQDVTDWMEVYGLLEARKDELAKGGN